MKDLIRAVLGLLFVMTPWFACVLLAVLLGGWRVAAVTVSLSAIVAVALGWSDLKDAGRRFAATMSEREGDI